MTETNRPIVCIDPTVYAEWELEAYADGVDLPHIKAHIEVCAHCHADLRKDQLFTETLTERLYRINCLSLDLIRDYHWGDLLPERYRQAREHLDECPLCTEEYNEFCASIQLQTTMQGNTEKKTENHAENHVMQPVHELWEQLDDFAQRASHQVGIVIGHLLSSPSLAASGVRSGQEPITLNKKTQASLLFEAGDLDLSLSLRQEAIGTLELSGQLLMIEPMIGPLVEAQGRFRLIPEDSGMASVDGVLDDTLCFRVDSMQMGRYQLILLLEEKTVVIPCLSLE